MFRLVNNGQSMIQKRFNEFQHHLTMRRIELYLAKARAADGYENYAQWLHYYETKVRAGDKEFVVERDRAKSALEWQVSAHKDTIVYHERMVERNVRELKEIKRQREMLEKGFARVIR